MQRGAATTQARAKAAAAAPAPIPRPASASTMSEAQTDVASLESEDAEHIKVRVVEEAKAAVQRWRKRLIVASVCECCSMGGRVCCGESRCA